MNSIAVVDSSVWIEIFNDGELAKKCTRELKKFSDLYVPTVVIFEVYRKILKSVGSEDAALSAIAFLSQYKTVELNKNIALLAGDLSLQYKLAMADSFVLAHAYYENGILLTLDFDFAKILNVRNLRTN